jgi:hypothetical protein
MARSIAQFVAQSDMRMEALFGFRVRTRSINPALYNGIFAPIRAIRA